MMEFGGDDGDGDDDDDKDQRAQYADIRKQHELTLAGLSDSGSLYSSNARCTSTLPCLPWRDARVRESDYGRRITGQRRIKKCGCITITRQG